MLYIFSLYYYCYFDCNYTVIIHHHHPILIRIYPHKWGWPDLHHPTSHLSNSHSPSCSIQGILLLKTNTLGLPLHLCLPDLLWSSSLPLALHFKLQCFSQNISIIPPQHMLVLLSSLCHSSIAPPQPHTAPPSPKLPQLPYHHYSQTTTTYNLSPTLHTHKSCSLSSPPHFLQATNIHYLPQLLTHLCTSPTHTLYIPSPHPHPKSLMRILLEHDF